jgi:Ser/Thr protein kinase RdoA (MazF antagonist)
MKPPPSDVHAWRPEVGVTPTLGTHDLSAGGDVLERVTAVARAAIRRWPEGAGAEVRLHTVSENATFLVEGPVGRSVLRVHRLGYHPPRAIDSELAWLDALRTGPARRGPGGEEAGDFRVPAVRRTTEGARVVEVEDGVSGELRSCVLFEHLPGGEPPADEAGFERLGALTAQLHHHAAGWDRPAGFIRSTWEPTTMVGGAGRWGRWVAGPGVGPAEVAVLERLAAVLEARLAAFGRGPERFGLIHADLRSANLLVEGGSSPAVIDFDDCGFGWWLYDLATACSFFEDSPAVPGLIARWLEGYRRVRPLPTADEAEVWTFVLLRRLLLLAWLGSHAAAPEAASLSAGFAAGTCDLAERYLRTHDIGLVTR